MLSKGIYMGTTDKTGIHSVIYINYLINAKFPAYDNYGYIKKSLFLENIH